MEIGTNKNIAQEYHIFQNIREIILKMGLPIGDLYQLETSRQTFDDGAQYRIEIPTVNSVEAVDMIINESTRLGLTINRITETYGMFRHTKQEICKMVSLCSEYGCQLMMSTGPRASYDTSATAGSVQGKTIGYRLRGQEQVVRAISDIFRGIELGVKAFLIYDEGFLMILGKMRENGDIPSEIQFKVSAHCGHGNPASFKLLENLGANSINPVRDLQLPMLSALRATVKTPIDCHTDNPVSSGGFIRTYEAPEVVRVAAPVYLKAGNSAISGHGEHTSKEDALRMVRQASIVKEIVNKHNPSAMQSRNKV